MGCWWDANFPWPNLWFWQAYPWSQRQSPNCTPFLGACNQIMPLRMQISAEWVKIEDRWGTWIWPPVHEKWAMSSCASIRRSTPLHRATNICLSDVQASSLVPLGPDRSTIASVMAASSDSGTPPTPLLGMDRNWPNGEPPGLPDHAGESCQIILDHLDNVPASAAICANWRWGMHHGYPGEHPNNGSWAGKGGESTMWMGLLRCDQGQWPKTSPGNTLACWHHLHDWAPQKCPGFTSSTSDTHLLWRTRWNGLLFGWQAHLGPHEGNERACPTFPSKSMPSFALSFSGFSLSVWHPFGRGGWRLALAISSLQWDPLCHLWGWESLDLAQGGDQSSGWRHFVDFFWWTSMGAHIADGMEDCSQIEQILGQWMHWTSGGSWIFTDSRIHLRHNCLGEHGIGLRPGHHGHTNQHSPPSSMAPDLATWWLHLCRWNWCHHHTACRTSLHQRSEQRGCDQSSTTGSGQTGKQTGPNHPSQQEPMGWFESCG